MIHNGIEHGMMSAIAEAFNIMRDGLGMELDEIADVYEKWNKEGELVCSRITIEFHTAY
jgi:6-phosphogluconate dehydrogenase